jgi:hypothetical protein
VSEIPYFSQSVVVVKIAKLTIEPAILSEKHPRIPKFLGGIWVIRYENDNLPNGAVG